MERRHRRARDLGALEQLADIMGAAPARGEQAAAVLCDAAAIATCADLFTASRVLQKPNFAVLVRPVVASGPGLRLGPRSWGDC